VKQKNLFTILNLWWSNCTFGLFCLASFSIERRMKEIIRKHSAQKQNVLLKELSKQYIVYCVVGFLIAVFPTYYLLNKWLEISLINWHFNLSIYYYLLSYCHWPNRSLRAFQATRVDVFTILKIRVIMLKKLNIFLYHIKNNKLFYGFECFGLSIGIAGLIFATLYWNDEHRLVELKRITFTWL
jgi:hypothetical protein